MRESIVLYITLALCPLLALMKFFHSHSSNMVLLSGGSTTRSSGPMSGGGVEVAFSPARPAMDTLAGSPQRWWQQYLREEV